MRITAADLFKNSTVGAAILIVWGFLCTLYGVFPLGHIQSLAITYIGLGFIDCLTLTNSWLSCPMASLPSEFVISFGLPMAMLASVLQRVSGIEGLVAYNVAGMLFLGVGVVSSWKLLRIFEVGHIGAIVGSFLFFSLPIVHGKASYAFLMWGFVLFPATVLSIVMYWRSRKPQYSVLYVTIGMIISLFQEPYSFVMAVVFGVVWIVTQFVFKYRAHWLELIGRTLGWIFACAVAVFLYKLYLPGASDFAVMPIDFFRGQGIDLLALFSRESSLYYFTMPWGIEGLDPLKFFTDGEAVRHVYLGVGIPIGLLIFIATCKFWKSAEYSAIVLVALMAFILALGPSLKINNQREHLPSSRISFTDYLMPKEAAIIELPHKFIYSVKPISVMRSVSRWYLLFGFMAILMLTIGIDRLSHLRWGRYGAGAVLCWLALEYLPNYGWKERNSKVVTQRFTAFNEQAVGELAKMVSPGERVVFISDRGFPNEYLSLYLCVKVGCKTFNTPGDKSLAQAKKQWPIQLQNFSGERVSKDGMMLIIQLLQDNIVDAVILPHFDLRWDSYSWPPSSGVLTTEKRMINQSFNASTVDRQSGEYFSVLKKKR